MFDSFRSFLDSCVKNDAFREINNANWDKEIGALAEATAELVQEPPLLIFDNIKDYPRGYRIASLVYSSCRRVAISLDLPLDSTKLELTRLASLRIKGAKAIPPKEVTDGPVMENKMVGDKIDAFSFPSPLFHAGDGGRYIGTGVVVISRDPDSGFTNMGTYRVQVHSKNLLGLWMSPAQHNRQICEKYWKKGESCPIVVATGVAPTVFYSSWTKLPWGKSELDFAGGLLGEPITVIRGPNTGLPIPSQAEIAFEGEIPPVSVEARDEGPFGEWPGYYSGGTIGTGKPQPVIRVKAIYYRNDPIIHEHSPMWTGAPNFALRFQSGLIWNQLQEMGVQNVAGVWAYNNYLIVVSINQQFPGHAKQAAHGVISCSAAVRHGRYIVVVDEDIDPSNLTEVMWAMETRVDPAKDIEIVEGLLTSGVDPLVSPQKRKVGDFTNSRAIFYAVRPFGWKNEFPKVSRSSLEHRKRAIDKYKNIIPFPSGTP